MEKFFQKLYRTSNLVLLSIEDQQAYVLAFLDPTLASMLKPRFGFGMPVYGDMSCMEELEVVFKQRYPLFQRRELFFDIHFKGGIRDLPAFLTKLEGLATAAELENIDLDALIAYKALSSIQDKELRRLCAREETLTLDRFRTLCISRLREVENLHQSSEINGASRQVVNAVDTECFYCGKRGHFANVCKKKIRDQSRRDGALPKSRTTDRDRAIEVVAAAAKHYQKGRKKKSHKRSSYKKHQARQVEGGSGTESESESSSSGPDEASLSDDPNRAHFISAR